MKINIIRIGNSQGIIIPLSILKQCNLIDSVELKIDNNNLIISPYNATRSNWADKFQLMVGNNDDVLLDEEINSWDEEEWEWEK